MKPWLQEWLMRPVDWFAAHPCQMPAPREGYKIGQIITIPGLNHIGYSVRDGESFTPRPIGLGFPKSVRIENP